MDTTYIFSAWAKRLRVLLFLVTYRNAAVVGNLETAVCSLWHPVCIWVWARPSPNPSERRGISFFHSIFFTAVLAYWHLESNLLCSWTSALCLLVFAVSKVDKWKLKSLNAFYCVALRTNILLCSSYLNTQGLKAGNHLCCC